MSAADSDSGLQMERLFRKITEFIFIQLKYNEEVDDWIAKMRKCIRQEIDCIFKSQGTFDHYLSCMTTITSESDLKKRLLGSLPPVLYGLLEVNILSQSRKKEIVQWRSQLQETEENVQSLTSQLHDMESSIQVMRADRDQLMIDISDREAAIKSLEKDAERNREAHHRLKQDFEELQQQYFKIKQAGRFDRTSSPGPPILTPYDPKWQGMLDRMEAVCKTMNTMIDDSTRVPKDRHLDSSPERDMQMRAPRYDDSHKGHDSLADIDSDELEADERKRESSPIPRRGKGTYRGDSNRGNDQYPQEKQSSASIIKFLNTAVPKFTKKGSAQIASHLELYESTMDSLTSLAVTPLNLSEADKIRFLPWVFDDRYRHYFTSFKERGIIRWQAVSHEVKLEFGPYRTISEAKRDVYRLTCRPDQSPREFLSVLKNSYSLAYRNPNWESLDFKQAYYDALPTQIKLSMANELDFGNSLEKMVTSATLLFNISGSSNVSGRNNRKYPERRVDETKVKADLNLESQQKKIPPAKVPIQQGQRQQQNPNQNRPQHPKGSDRDSSGSGNQDYRPRFNRRYQGYQGYQGNQGSQRYRGYQGYREPQGY
ncbi:uncharacterized protein, partial [Hyperolius riggenbachi]|uniref:uncharacterized protein n=1 Tax=Hyperolius riggenbachi TaxID=752182 RepID=UPI0035A3D54D